MDSLPKELHQIVQQLEKGYSEEYNPLNFDIYRLTFGEDKVLAGGEQYMDDRHLSEGCTSWSAAVPRELAVQSLQRLLESGKSGFETETLVHKTSRNRWKAYSLVPEEKQEEYLYRVKIELEMVPKMANQDLRLMIWFQDNMKVYF